jgi:flagellar L-ring protein precursor FlgH
MDKNSDNKIGLTSLFGSSLTTNNPVGGNDLSLNAGYSADRSTKGDSKSGQSNSLTGSITVTVADVLPNGIIAVRGEKWLTLNTGDELVRIAGLVRADDIATDNTVSSTRVADARITYSGTGAFADASQPGWFDRFFLSPLFPF